ncbi:UDP-galactose-lipid carrier transferase [Oxalobacteraceae bacterium IMCC9480]|nr:UDP-galactose-lipid carrier transferase [Oxalobacteraceae bacterium IMCC9480]
MNVSAQFRPKKSNKISDGDAGDKPLSSSDKANDKQDVDALAQKIAELQNMLYAEHDRKLLVVFQGMDTSGKDGAVKDVLGRINPSGIRGVAFKAPTAFEKDHDFLWRVHHQTPASGQIAVFNRSHYEDVLIARVHDWIDDDERTRRLARICDFERLLVETGTVIVKFFLHISKDEQKGRLEDRLAEPDKHWKFDPQDIEERKLWDAYQDAYTVAINATDTDHAPWFVIPANSKTHRNLAIASILLETLEAMKLAYPPANPALKNLKII